MQRSLIRKKNNRRGFIITAILLIAVATAFIVSQFFFFFMLIRGESMSPTYHNLDLVVIDKRTAGYETGSVVAFKCAGLNAVLVKRIAACPGDQVKIAGERLLVNGEEMPPYIGKGFSYSGILENEIILEEGQYIVIGDNIEESKDSRYPEVGIVMEKDILGRVL